MKVKNVCFKILLTLFVTLLSFNAQALDNLSAFDRVKEIKANNSISKASGTTWEDITASFGTEQVNKISSFYDDHAYSIKALCRINSESNARKCIAFKILRNMFYT